MPEYGFFSDSHFFVLGQNLRFVLYMGKYGLEKNPYSLIFYAVISNYRSSLFNKAVVVSCCVIDRKQPEVDMVKPGNEKINDTLRRKLRFTQFNIKMYY